MNGRKPGPGQLSLDGQIHGVAPDTGDVHEAEPFDQDDIAGHPRPSLLRKLTGPPPKARRHGQRWTDDEEAWLVRRYREGAEVWLIGLELGRSTWAASKRLYVLNEQRHENCAQCGTPLSQTGQAGHPMLFCDSCIAARRRAPEVGNLTCPVCQQIFTPDDNDERNIYCGKRCSDAAWYERLRERREEARRRFGAQGAEVNDAQRQEVLRLHALGASFRAIEASVGVQRKAARAVLHEAQLQPLP